MTDRLGNSVCEGRGWGTALARLLAVFALAACTSTVPAKPPPPQEPPPAMPAPLPRVSESPLPPPGGLAPFPGNAGTGAGIAGDAVKVGLLVPLSGDNAALGEDLLQAAQMALFDRGTERFAVLPRDTKATPAGAAEAARQLNALGVQLIIGPVFSAEVEAVKAARAPAAPGGAASGIPGSPGAGSAAGAPVLAFSNDTQRAGGGVWMMGLSPDDQVRRVVSYARERGAQHFAVLAPRSPYGDTAIRAMRDVVQRFGVSPPREERYGASEPDMATAVRRLVPPGAGAPGLPGPAFDALLIADGGARVRRLAALLSEAGLDSRRVRLLGTQLWDEPALAREPALQGAWFAGPLPQARADFESRFEALYQRRPVRLAALAYDAAALAAVLAQSPATAGMEAGVLTNPGGFAGMEGIFRLRADGLVERGLAVMELAPEGVRVVDAPPAGFDPLAY